MSLLHLLEWLCLKAEGLHIVEQFFLLASDILYSTALHLLDVHLIYVPHNFPLLVFPTYLVPVVLNGLDSSLKILFVLEDVVTLGDFFLLLDDS